MISKEEYIKFMNLWDDFKKEVIYNNRFFTDHEILRIIERLSSKCEYKLIKDKVLYRARVFKGDDIHRIFYNQTLQEVVDTNPDESDKLFYTYLYYSNKTRMDEGFWGYGKEDSFVPPDNNRVSDGRINPSYIKYLYTAESPYTALVEIKPYLKKRISIAEISVNEELRLFDFTTKSLKQLIQNDDSDWYVIHYMISLFSEPSSTNNMNYIPIQYISEYIKSLNFDGIRFKSSLDENGKNIVIFNYNKCTPISSRLYDVESISYKAKSILDDELLLDKASGNMLLPKLP